MKKLLVILLLLGTPILHAQNAKDTLLGGFENPPESARPRVWWHWMNGNITKEGIKLDLEWMQRVGIGGFQNFDASMLTARVVDKPLLYMTPEWKDAFRYATTLADQLGLEEGIAGSPGWSESGGPWVPPNEAMKKYVWSEMRVEGGKPFTGTLPHPPANTGAFQNLPVDDPSGGVSASAAVPSYYADSLVIAYRIPRSDLPNEPSHPVITSSSPIDASLLMDGDLVKTTVLALSPEIGGKAWIQYQFSAPQTIRAITLVDGKKDLVSSFIPAGSPSGQVLEASDDGIAFHAVIDIPFGGAAEHTLAFSPVTAKYFRLTFTTLVPPPNPLAAYGFASTKPPKSIPVAEFILHPGARVHRFEEKAAFKPLAGLESFPTPEYTAQDVIQKSEVVDLTSKMHPDGTLDWTPPPGEWAVLRFGYSLLGITNHPATKEATGLEVDKLNRVFVKNYMNAYLDSHKDTVGADMMGKKGLRFVVNDSWEAGAQNWSEHILDEFVARRGYDPHPWLPVLAGHVVENSKSSDQFLWDFRKTIADLIADEHYGQVEASLKARGMGHYGESHEDGRALIADGMEVKKMDDIPMGAMWMQKLDVNQTMFNYNADDRESASVAHIYGQNLAAAESMTSCDSSTAYAWSPSTLKPTADMEFLNGINRIVVHDSAHQPFVDRVPGFSLGPCGQWFNRNETWAEDAGPWVSYLARNSWMLQQGKFVADILYFYGEDTNLTALFHTSAPELPVGYNFDYINADGLIHELSVSNGVIATKSGMNYRILVLDKNSRHMSLPVLRALHALVAHGAVVVGERPVDTPSLADDSAEYQKLGDEIFGKGGGVQSFAKGKVYAGQNTETVLKALRIEPDFAYAKPVKDEPVLYVHRRLADADIYFLDNRSDHDAAIDATFRKTGKAPELWYAETGKTTAAPYTIAGGRTSVPLHLDPWGSVFVVFRNPTKKTSNIIPAKVESRLTSIGSPWTVNFQPGRGAPASLTFDKLTSWSDSTDEGVRYFSGYATYSQTMQAPPNWFSNGASLWLDLGEVKNIAVVTVNGKDLGTVWHAPYRVDLTGSLKPGQNQISIKVINSWVNRLIGDLQPDAKTKYTFTSWKVYKKDSPLLPSGLIGPVSVIQETMK